MLLSLAMSSESSMAVLILLIYSVYLRSHTSSAVGGISKLTKTGTQYFRVKFLCSPETVSLLGQFSMF